MALLRQIIVNAQTMHYAFLTMVKSCERGKHDINGILETWYTIAFQNTYIFTGDIDTMIHKIQLQLLINGYKEQGLIFKPKRLIKHFYKGE